MHGQNEMTGDDELYARLKALRQKFCGNDLPAPPLDPSVSWCETFEEDDPSSLTTPPEDTPIPPEIEERLERLRRQPTEEINTPDAQVSEEPDQLTNS